MTPETLWIAASAAACAVPCSLLGCYLVLRRLSLLGDAISHSVLPGLVLAFLVSGRVSGWPIFVGAVAFGLLTSLLADATRRLSGVREDASLGVVFASLFALGVLLLHRVNVDLDPGCVLYGLLELAPINTMPLFGVDVPRALFGLVPALAATLLFVVLFWKELKLTSFDPALATALGLRASWVHLLLLALVSGVTVASFEAVGSILVVAMLIVPAATAQLLTDRLWVMLVLSVVVALLSAVGGTLTATWLNTSVAGMMAVTAGCQFALAVVAAPRHGLASKAVRHLALTVRITAEDVLSRLYRREEGPTHGKDSEPVFGGRLAALTLRWRGEVASADGGGLRLTDAGRRRAESLVRAHRLWEAYLSRELNLPSDHVHEPAAAMEHFLDEQLQKKLTAELDGPSHDPHGRPIPREG